MFKRIVRIIHIIPIYFYWPSFGPNVKIQKAKSQNTRRVHPTMMLDPASSFKTNIKYKNNVSTVENHDDNRVKESKDPNTGRRRLPEYRSVNVQIGTNVKSKPSNIPSPPQVRAKKVTLSDRRVGNHILYPFNLRG